MMFRTVRRCPSGTSVWEAVELKSGFPYRANGSIQGRFRTRNPNPQIANALAARQNSTRVRTTKGAYAIIATGYHTMHCDANEKPAVKSRARPSAGTRPPVFTDRLKRTSSQGTKVN